MNQLLNLLTGLLTLKQGPQDAPSLPVPMLLAYVMSGLAQVSALNIAPKSSFILVAGEAALLCAAAMIFLNICGKPVRWPQTITALCLGGTFFNLLSMVVVAILPVGTAAEPNPLTAMLSLVIMIWYFAFAGGVLRHAGEIPMALGVGLMVIYQLVIMAVLPWPEPAALTERSAISALSSPSQAAAVSLHG